MKKMMIKLTALSAMIFLPACGDKAEEIQKGFQLQGEYQSDGNAGLSIQTKGIGCLVYEADITANKMVLTETFIDKADCSGKEIGKVVTTTKINIGQELTTAPGARAMDLKIKKVEVIPLDESWLSIFGADLTQECNVADKPLGSRIEVTGKDCGVLGSYPPKNTVYFGTFQLRDDVLKISNSPSVDKKHLGTTKNIAPRDKELRLTLVKR